MQLIQTLTLVLARTSLPLSSKQYYISKVVYEGLTEKTKIELKELLEEAQEKNQEQLEKLKNATIKLEERINKLITSSSRSAIDQILTSSIQKADKKILDFEHQMEKEYQEAISKIKSLVEQ